MKEEEEEEEEKEQRGGVRGGGEARPQEKWSWDHLPIYTVTEL